MSTPATVVAHLPIGSHTSSVFNGFVLTTCSAAPSWESTPPDILNHVLSLLSVMQLLLVGQTSRMNYGLVKRHIQRRVLLLLVDFSLPRSMPNFMHVFDIVLSGSAVLSVLIPNSFVPNDLDIYVPVGALTIVDAFLFIETLYVKIERPQILSYNYVSAATADTGIKSVVFYRHSVTHTVLNIIETTGPIPTTAIFKFHSTFVMNYITSNAMVCAYPKMTDSFYGLVNSQSLCLPSRMVRCLVKYALRGFHTLHRAYDWKNQVHNCDSYPYCGRCTRSVMDQTTMRVSLRHGIGSALNLIDPDLSWSLSCRYNCNIVKLPAPESGFVMAPEGT